MHGKQVTSILIITLGINSDKPLKEPVAGILFNSSKNAREKKVKKTNVRTNKEA